MDNKLIDLYGHSLSILFKDNNVLSLLFLDDSYGKLVCTVPCELPLYRMIERDKKYHLQVELKGISKVRGMGRSYTSNYLIVKNVEIIYPPYQK